MARGQNDSVFVADAQLNGEDVSVQFWGRMLGERLSSRSDSYPFCFPKTMQELEDLVHEGQWLMLLGVQVNENRKSAQRYLNFSCSERTVVLAVSEVQAEGIMADIQMANPGVDPVHEDVAGAFTSECPHQSQYAKVCLTCRAAPTEEYPENNTVYCGHCKEITEAAMELSMFGTLEYEDRGVTRSVACAVTDEDVASAMYGVNYTEALFAELGMRDHGKLLRAAVHGTFRCVVRGKTRTVISSFSAKKARAN